MRRVLFSGVISFLSVSLYAAPSGETLFQGNCVTCHDYTKTLSAPAIKEIQARYKNVFHTKEAFVSFTVRWLNAPDAKSAILQDAVKKFELMPTIGVDQESLKAIAEFLYDGSF